MIPPSSDKRVIVVEGKTDFHVVSNLLKKDNLQLQVYSEDGSDGEKGIELLLKKIPMRLESELECIGFVFDANGNPVNRWKQVRNQILKSHPKAEKMKLDRCIPEMPVSKGICVSDYKPVVGMWMMPNNKDEGTIEKFLSYMIHPEDLCWKYAQKYIENVPETERKFHNKYVTKANIHAWLAVQKEPGNPPGTAIAAGYLNIEEPKVQPFREWLGKL